MFRNSIPRDIYFVSLWDISWHDMEAYFFLKNAIAGHTLSLVHPILAPYLYFKGAKNVPVLQVLIQGYGGCWRFLTGGWYLNLDLDMITGLWDTHAPNFGSLTWSWRCRERPCPVDQPRVRDLILSVRWGGVPVKARIVVTSGQPSQPLLRTGQLWLWALAWAWQ